MKKLTKRILPLILSVVIAAGSVVGSYEQVQATGITDILYYTYWDLISTIYAQCGYSTTVDADVINNHGVTGKQVWDNFCTSVENTAKFHYGILNDAKEQAIKDLKNLAKTATAKGIKLTQDLYDLLKDTFNYQQSYKGLSSYGNYDETLKYINSVMGITDAYTWSGGTVNDYDIWIALKNGEHLNVIQYGSEKCVFTTFANYVDLKLDKTNWGYGVYYKRVSDKFFQLESTVGYTANSVTLKTGSQKLDSIYYEPSWVIKNGYFLGTDTISAQVSEGACPKEVPEVTPWHKETDIPDGWRVVPQEVPGTGGDQEPEKDPDKDPEEEPKKNPDILPGGVPLPSNPISPDEKPLPDSTEEPGKKPDSTEDPAKDPDKDPDKEPAKEPAKDPGILVNPQTGNLIDPATGYDIDPKTGLLIDPETGELIDPKNLPDSDDDSGGDGGGGGLPGAVSGFGDITKLFPFCIPFDLVKLIKGMQAKEAAPKFHFEYHFDSINYTFVVDVDLTDYAKYIKIFRFGMQVFYAIALMLLTIKVSKLFV